MIEFYIRPGKHATIKLQSSDNFSVTNTLFYNSLINDRPQFVKLKRNLSVYSLNFMHIKNITPSLSLT